MKRLIVLGLALAAMATAALAQQAPAPAEQKAPAAPRDHASPSSQPGGSDATNRFGVMSRRGHSEQPPKD
jgi:hypothetical protein